MQKELEKLVARLNGVPHFTRGYFKLVDRQKVGNVFHIVFVRTEKPNEEYPFLLFTIYTEDFSWVLGNSFGGHENEIHHLVFDFLFKIHTYKKAKDKRYNVIIGKGVNEVGTEINIAYKKWGGGTFTTNNDVCEDDLSTSPYQFSEDDIEDLKSTLSDNMIKIVDLGKVEVKDEDIK